jgi:hypothetical protein
MRASARLDAYLAGKEHYPTTSHIVTDMREHDEDAALRAMVRRRMELRLKGYDMSQGDTPRIASAVSRDAGLSATAIGSAPLTSIAPDDGEVAVAEEGVEVVDASQPPTALTPRGEVAVPSRVRAADAILKRLVQELGAHAPREGEFGDGQTLSEGDEGESWRPSGTDWSQAPEFLSNSSAMSAKAMREKYPDMFGGNVLN